MLGLDVNRRLPLHCRQALQNAAGLVVAECRRSVIDMRDGCPFVKTEMAYFLPRKYALRYTPEVVEQFSDAVVAVARKLFAAGFQSCDCVAEQMALSAIIAAAKEGLELRYELVGRRPPSPQPLEDLFEAAMEDADFEMLFVGELDGIEDDAELGQYLGWRNLRFEDWFKPFEFDGS